MLVVAERNASCYALSIRSATIPPMDWPAWVGIAVAALGLGIGELRAFRSSRRADQAERRAVSREEEAALASTAWAFNYELRLVIGDNVPKRPPISISIEGSNMWIHGARLSWRPQGAENWVVEDARCEPWFADQVFPVQLFTPGSRELDFRWPGANPQERGPLGMVLAVTYSVSEHGEKRRRSVGSGSTGWQ